MILSCLFLVIHCLVLLYQVITLNVAVNSYSTSVLSLLVSNQFMELKSSVFKKFERENLFQLSFSDSIERFQLFIFIFIIFSRNLSQQIGSNFWEIWNRTLQPLALIFGTEIFIDSLKHAFITKFNHIPSSYYHNFKETLKNDFISLNSPHSPDQSSILSRKMGFSSIPHSCLLIVVFLNLIKGRQDITFLRIALFFSFLLTLKLLLNSFLNYFTSKTVNETKSKE